MYNVKVPVCMNLPIPQIRPHLRRKHLHLLNRPAQSPRKQRKTHALCSPIEILAHPLAQLFESLVFWPRIDRPLDGYRDNVYEARAMHHVRDMRDRVEWKTGFVSAFVHVAVPAVQGGFRGE